MGQGIFLESIRIIDNKPQLLEYHIERMQRSLKVCLASALSFDVATFIDDYLAHKELQGIHKLRFEYDDKAVYNISIQPYTTRFVHKLYPYPIADNTCYRHKWRERSALSVPQHIAMMDATEVIFTYHGYLTDTSYSNIVVKSDNGIWLTPKTPLLKGIMRQYLLDEKRIEEADLHYTDLEMFTEFRLINALLPL